MSAPQLTVYADGQGTVAGDGLNTFCSTCDSMGDLRSFVGIQGIQVYVRGTSSPGDGGQGDFFWNANGTAPDDNGVTTVVPPGSGSGVWTRLSLDSSNGARQSGEPDGPATTASTSAVMAGLAQTFTPKTTGAFLLIVSGTAQSDTINNGGIISLRFANGVPPVAGVAQVGASVVDPIRFLVAAVGQNIPFTVQGYVTGLTLGTSYWLDLGLTADPGGTLSVNRITATILEI